MRNLVNLEEETRNGYLITAEMKRVWSVQLDMFQQLIDVCQAHGLRCWCDGGTLLGVVRHHGYIPWDDDIDVCMPRPDYDRLQEIADTAFAAPYFLQTAKTDEHYFCGHAQLRRSDTAAIRPADCYRPYNQGIFIDIFVFEGVPDDLDEVRETLKKANRRMKQLKSIDYPILSSGHLGLVFRKWKWRYMVKRHGFYNLWKPVEDALRRHSWDDCDRVAELGFEGLRYVLPRHIFDDTLWLDFEQTKVPVPAGYDTFLRTQYGDHYMTPVMAPNSHGSLVLDTERSYRDLLPEVRREYRRSALKRLWRKIGGKR